jgi:uncharacterized membrane protein
MVTKSKRKYSVTKNKITWLISTCITLEVLAVLVANYGLNHVQWLCNNNNQYTTNHEYIIISGVLALLGILLSIYLLFLSIKNKRVKVIIGAIILLLFCLLAGFIATVLANGFINFCGFSF